MKRSLIRFLTALTVVSLFMLSSAPAADAAPWGLAIDTGLRGAAWFASVREWLQGPVGTAPAPKNRQKAVQQGKADDDDDKAPTRQGDHGCGIDPGGAPAPCR